MRIDSATALAKALIDAAAAGERSACLFSDTLTPSLYGTTEFTDALRQLALAHDRARICVLIRQADRVLVDGDHPLVTLARRLPSRMALLQAGETAMEDEREFLVIDDQRLVLRPRCERWDAVARDDDPGLARQTRRVFDRYWEQGQRAPALAQLSL